jgi:endoglucanase
LRGAHIAAHKVDPDLAIVLECTTADDLPVKDEEIGYPRLGDGPSIHLAREGVAAITIAPPSRYIHSPAALMELTDMWNGIKLVAAVLAALPADW